MKIYIAKADQELEINVDALTPETITYIVKYGLTQSLNDAAASVPKDSADAADKTMALVNKRLDKLLAGNPPAIGTRVGGGDPVRKRAIEIFLSRVVKPRWAKAGKKVDPKAQQAEAIAGVKANAAYLDIAAKQLEREAAEVAELEAMTAGAVEAAVEELTIEENEPLDENAVL